MKLIPFMLLTLSLTGDIEAQEHYTFPPHFQTPSPSLFSSDSSLYLPPESHTPVPLYPVKNTNHFPFQYLPPSGSKTPVGFPKPFPILMSSTPRQNDDDDGDDDDSRNTQFLRNQNNHTEWNKDREKKELRQIPRIANYHNNIDRIDMKLPYQYNVNTLSTIISPKQTIPRNVIISENHMNDRADLVKAASFPQYVQQPPPGVFISSTTEPAIPILRLSNEMDLDGSFSYEALGADQTHYVQHSRMENMGTDKEEQVVEGSYSYVGDNGQTYTVHYVADSNGFRASGDHLPVPPPIPEIIQRAVQYNLAEEAKKPPHLKSWQYDERENDLSESEKSHRFAISPPRNLFTGRAPESFSYNFAQGPVNSQNNLATAESSQTSVKVEYKPDQIKSPINSGTISPQITFLASQGAHVPSMNTVQDNKKSAARIFTTEKSMPQLMNYDAGIKESEDNKALWRWQYGLAVNANQNPDKHSISRSFAEGDDVMINFNDMTPEQYTSMMRSQLESKEYKEQENKGAPYEATSPQVSQNHDNALLKSQSSDDLYYQINISNMKEKEQADAKDGSIGSTNARDNQNYLNTPQKTQSNNAENYQFQNLNIGNIMNNNDDTSTSEQPVTNQYYTNTFKPSKSYEIIQNQNVHSVHQNYGSPRPAIITQREFIPASQTVTKSYDYEDPSYEPRRIKASNMQSEREPNETNLKVIPLNNDKTIKQNVWQTSIDSVSNMPITQIPLFPESTANTVKFEHFIVPENTDEFKPLFNTAEPLKQETTTAYEGSNEDVQENIFLKKYFSKDNSEQNMYETFDQIEKTTTKVPEVKTDKSPKYIQHLPKSSNTVKTVDKPFDVSQVLNYITAKNIFEFSKVNPKPLQTYSNFNYKYDDSFYDDEEEMEQQNSKIKPMGKQHPELRGNIKNYKVLQRNNSQLNHEHDKYIYLKRNLAPPPMKSANLPPLGRAGPSVKSYLPPIYV